MWCSFLVAAGIALAIKWYLSLDPKPIHGIYQVPGKWYWVKFIVFYALVTLRKWQNTRAQQKGVTAEGAGYGVKSKNDVSAMESVQPLSSHPKAIDAVYFQAANKDGCYFVAATARRPERVINGFLYLRIPELGILMSPKLPDTMLFGTEDEFGAEGLKLELVEPMKSWRVTYSGLLKKEKNPSETVQAEINLLWHSELKPFDFDVDMSQTALSRSIAREPWSREYFKVLQDAHQTHYEQMGTLEGTAIIDKVTYKLKLDSMRDHSYGEKREWKLFHRYGFHTLTLADGTRLNVGIVSQPATCSVLELGYLYLPDGRLFPVDAVNLNLWHMGEGGTPPRDYGFTFKAVNRTWDVQIQVIESPEFYIGWEWEARVVERMCRCTINGIEGWGICEWEYRNMSGRPVEIQANDPAWTHTLNKG